MQRFLLFAIGHLRAVSSRFTPMGKNRRRNLSPSSTTNLWPVFAIETDRGWRVVRNVPQAEAELKVERGEFVRVYDELTKACVGYKPSSGPSSPGDLDFPSHGSRPSITARESQTIAGARGRSRTVGMSEDRKISRRNLSGHLCAPEDAVELAMEKFRVWPEIGDTKAVRVSPKA